MDYIEIKGYKSIKSARVDLKPINILIGANGSGKSNFLSFFELLSRLYASKLNEYVELNGGANKFLHKGQKVTNEISFQIEFDNGKKSYTFTLTADMNGFILKPKDINHPIFDEIEANISKFDKVIDLSIELYKELIEYSNPKNIRKYHFHDTGKQSPFTQLSHIENDIYYLYETGSNLAAFLFNISQSNKIVYNRIISTIQSIAPYFSDFYLQPNSGKYIRLQWTDKYSDTIYGVTDLSDGTMQFIALATLFMQPNLPSVIIIDEPELGLHPTAIAKLAGMIQSAAAKGCQVIVATQSTDLISHFAPEDILTVDQIDGESVFERLNSKSLAHWLDEYTIDDLWKRNIISTGQPNY